MKNKRSCNEDVDKAIELLTSDAEVIALLAPSVDKSFCDTKEKEKFLAVLKDIGFSSWMRISDIANEFAILEVETWKKQSKNEKCCIASSCPLIAKIIERDYPELKDLLSSTGSIMYQAAKKIKKQNPLCKTIFICPCFWKKEELTWHKVKNVEVVLTFEEFADVLKIMKANYEWNYKENLSINLKKEEAKKSSAMLPKMCSLLEAKNVEEKTDFLYVTGLVECKRILEEIQNNQYRKYYIEIMACKGGCHPIDLQQ